MRLYRMRTAIHSKNEEQAVSKFSKRVSTILFIVILLAALSGCQSKPTQDQIDNNSIATIITQNIESQAPITTALPDATLTQDAITATPLPATPVALEVEGGVLHLMMPDSFKMQPFERFEGQAYPYKYVFTNEKTGTWLAVYTELDDKKSQSILLRKLYDSSNKFIVEEVVIGEHQFLVHSNQMMLYDYVFRLGSAAGYSYQFGYSLLPEGFEGEVPAYQYEIPQEAIDILSTLTISN